MTMFHFIFISHLRAALFFNMLKTLKQLLNAEIICFRVLFQFYFTYASVWNKIIAVLFHVVLTPVVQKFTKMATNARVLVENKVG